MLILHTTEASKIGFAEDFGILITGKKVSFHQRIDDCLCNLASTKFTLQYEADSLKLKTHFSDDIELMQ